MDSQDRIKARAFDMLLELHDLENYGGSAFNIVSLLFREYTKNEQKAILYDTIFMPHTFMKQGSE